jgi:hypothetical protein
MTIITNAFKKVEENDHLQDSRSKKMAAILFIRYNYEVLSYLYISHFIAAFLSSFTGSVYGRHDRGSI